MHLYTSSFSIKVAAFVGLLIAAFVGAELYAREALYVRSSEMFNLRRFTSNDPGNGVFGDSQIGSEPYIDGYSFYGTAGQQPSETLRLLKYIYVSDRPNKIILEMAPQWFGRYHDGREEYITDELLPPARLKLMMLSPYFYRALKDGLLDVAKGLLARGIGMAWAAPPHGDLEEPTREEILDINRQWEDALKRHGNDSTFQWSMLPAPTRHRATLSRVHSQNPRDGFAASPAAAELEAVIRFLVDQGARLCLYRPPVTAEFERLAYLVPRSNYVEFDRWANDIAARYRLRWVRYQSLPRPFPDSDFYNQDHLNVPALKATWPLVEKACFTEG